MSSIIDKIAEVEKDRADRLYKMRFVMNEPDHFITRDDGISYTKRTPPKNMDEYDDWDMMIETKHFNDHSIIGFENRNVND